MELPFDPVIPLPGNTHEESLNTNSKEIMRPMFTAVLFTIAKIWKWPMCPSSVDECLKTLGYSLLLIQKFFSDTLRHEGSKQREKGRWQQ